MEDEPIYAFDELKSLLTSLGYNVKEATGYREIENTDVDLNDFNNKIEFTPDGIFLKMEDGSKQQIFLYKRRYHLNRYGKPRFHLRECETIKSYIASGTFKLEYRRANTNIVKVIDMDDFDTEKEISDLPLCKYCAKKDLPLFLPPKKLHKCLFHKITLLLYKYFAQFASTF